MRSRLTPDGSKLVIATNGGYMMVVHDLDLDRLADDLHGFKPNMYHLMQMCHSPVRQVYVFNHLFTRRRNRVELISDFPAQNDVEMISSIDVRRPSIVYFVSISKLLILFLLCPVALNFRDWLPD